MIRFRNIEVDGFLVGKAAYTGKNSPLHYYYNYHFILLIATVRKKWSLYGMKRLPPTSGHCCWQLEKVDCDHFYG